MKTYLSTKDFVFFMWIFVILFVHSFSFAQIKYELNLYPNSSSPIDSNSKKLVSSVIINSEFHSSSSLICIESSSSSAKIDSTKNIYNIPNEILDLWDSLTIKQKAAQMVMVYLTPANFILRHEFGGVLVAKNHLKNAELFSQNIKQVNDNLKIPLFVATDQEGGTVNRIERLFPKWKNAPSALVMRNMPPDKIESLAQEISKDLKSLGINMNLAPVLDPSLDHRNQKTFMEESRRSWGNDSSRIEKIQAFVSGMKKNGVICVSKHFPGYDSWTNSDFQIAVSSSPKNIMSKNYQFFKKFSNDIPVTMMSSVRFTKVSNKPAVFEPKIVRMARKIGEETVILTDDLWGTSLRAWISGEDRAKYKNYPKKDFEKLIREALVAGNDMLMITYPAKAIEMIYYLEKLANQNSTYKKRIEESSARIIKLKYKAGLFKH